MTSTEVEDVELRMIGPNVADIPDDHSHDVIPNEQLAEFADILEDDNVDAFNAWSAERRGLYLRGRFQYKKGDMTHHNKTKILQIPFNLAVGYCAVNIVKEFINKGVDMTRTDIKKSNVLHIVAIAASLDREKEEKYIPLAKTLLNALSPDLLSQLCIQEDDDGLRPLEFASIMGSFAVFNCIIEKQGYIKGRVKHMGLSKLHTYNISDYEPGCGLTRLIRNPLKLMIFVNSEGFESLKKFESLQLPIVKKWSMHMLKACSPFLLFWWIIRLLFLGAIAYLDPAVVLYTERCTNYTPRAEEAGTMKYDQCTKFGNYTTPQLEVDMRLNYIIVFWSNFMVVMDVLDFIVRMLHKDRRRAYARLFHRSFGSFTVSYRLAIFGLYLIAIIAPRMGDLYPEGEGFRQILMVKAFQLPLILYSFLHILEFMPIVGIFAITIQKMLVTLVVFLSFLLPVKVVFSQFLQFFAQRYGFATFKEGIYLLFLMDMGSFDFGDTPDMVIELVHVFYFLVMIILLFNYLIGVLSIVADQTSEDREVLVKLRRLQMIGEVEERVGHWFWLLVRVVRRRRHGRTLLIA